MLGARAVVRVPSVRADSFNENLLLSGVNHLLVGTCLGFNPTAALLQASEPFTRWNTPWF